MENGPAYSCCVKFASGVGNWIWYYVGGWKAATLISGLVFAHGLVENAVTGIMITYLTEQLGQKLPKAAATINIQDGLTNLMAIVSAYIADVYVGRYFMVSCSTSLFTIGLVILWRSAATDRRNWLFYMSLVLLVLGKGSHSPSLKAFGADQIKAHDKDETRAEVRTEVWWRIFWCLGIIVSTFTVSNIESWATTFLVSALVMAGACAIFLCGTHWYERPKPKGSGLTDVLRVLIAASLKIRLDYPPDATHLYEKNYVDENQQLLPHTSSLRLLDKAAIIESSPPSLEEQERKWRLCTVTQVEETKRILRMFPMWTTFLMYSLVNSTGNTFFLEQASNMDRRLGKVKVPVASLLVIKSLSREVISYLYKKLSKIMFTESQRRLAAQVQIAVGMLLSVFCCSIARPIEVQRLNLVSQYGEEPLPMTVIWLVPQFVLLGAMNALAEGGLEDFFSFQVSESMKSYGPEFNNCVIGIGNLLTVFSIFASNRVAKWTGGIDWFGDGIDDSYLDRYYRLLTVLCYLNFLLHCFTSKRYYCYKETSAEEEVLKLYDTLINSEV